MIMKKINKQVSNKPLTRTEQLNELTMRLDYQIFFNQHQLDFCQQYLATMQASMKKQNKQVKSAEKTITKIDITKNLEDHHFMKHLRALLKIK